MGRQRKALKVRGFSVILVVVVRGSLRGVAGGDCYTLGAGFRALSSVVSGCFEANEASAE